jgi:hypothetical protein
MKRDATDVAALRVVDFLIHGRINGRSVGFQGERHAAAAEPFQHFGPGSNGCRA